MAKLKETPAGRSLHNYTNIRNLQSAVLLWKKKKGFGKFRLIVLFILHQLGNGCDLEKKKMVRFVTPIRWQESPRIFKGKVICVFFLHTLSADSQYLTLGIRLEVFKRDLSGNLFRKTSAMRIYRKN